MESKPCKQCGVTMNRMPGHSDYNWRLKDFCDTNCRVKYGQRHGHHRCKYCGEVLVLLKKPNGHGVRKNGQFCGRECFVSFVRDVPGLREDCDEPSEEEKAEQEARKLECRLREVGHLQTCERNDG